MDLLALHIPEQHVGTNRFWHKVGRSQQFPQRLRVGQLGVKQIIPGIEQTDNIVGILLAHRKA